MMEKIKKLIKTGFFSIFTATFFSKVIAFLGNILVVRILSKNDYGIYVYAINAMSMLYIFNDFGASNSALQSLTEERNNKSKQRIILKYALKMGLIGSIFSGLLILLSPFFYPFKINEAKFFTPILFLIPLLSNANAFISVVFRANLENKKYAIMEFSKTFFNYIFLIVLSYLYGIIGAILSQYFYTFVSLIIGFILMKKTYRYKEKNKDKMDKIEKEKFVKYAVVTQLNSTLCSVLLYIDIFLIGFILENSDDVALYKVASTIPMALAMIPTCIMIYVLPYFVMNNKNIEWVEDKYKKLIKYGILLYGFISVSFIVMAPLIFRILYGTDYNEGINIFRLLMVGFFFNATFRTPSYNILYSMRKLKVNLYTSIISVVLNILLNVIFINLIGIIGAALTTTVIDIIGSIILFIYVRGKKSEKNYN